MEEGIEFVKHFRSHLSTGGFFFIFIYQKNKTFIADAINALAANHNGTYLCTASVDKSLKIFDIINFDMINMIKLDYVPMCAEWIHSAGDAISALAVYVLSNFILPAFIYIFLFVSAAPLLMKQRSMCTMAKERTSRCMSSIKCTQNRCV